MDLTESIAPKSDQLNADDLIAGPVTVTIVEVNRGTAEQPFNFVTQEFGPGRPFRPSKSMRRVMVSAWGKESSVYSGRRMTLYREPKIKFGGEEVGGIRISHTSHIDGPLKVVLSVARGKRETLIVQPLTDSITSAQSDQLHTLFKAHALDKAAALDLCTQEAGRPIASTRDLTAAEADLIIQALPPKPGDPS